MNTARSIFKNTLALFLARLSYMGSSVLLVFFLSRSLQAEGLGSYSTAMAFFSLGGLACELGLPNFIPRELAKDLSQTNRYLTHTSVLAIVTALVIVLGLAGVTPNLSYSSETIVSILLAALALIPTALRVVLNAIFVSHHRTEYMAFTTLVWTIVRVVGSLYLLQRGYGVVSIMTIFSLTSFLSVLNSFYYYVKYIDTPRWEFDWGFFKSMLRDLKAFILLAVIGSIFNQSETIILSLVKNETEVGFYSAAFKLITLWYLIPQSYMSVVFPVLTRSHQESTQRSQAIQEKSIKYLLALALPLAIGGFVTANQVIPTFYGPGFEEAVLVFRIMSWHTVLAFVNNVLWRTLLARDQQNLAVRVQWVSGVARIGLALVLTPWLGAVGAACALIGGYTIYTVMHVYYIQRGGTPIPFVQLGWRFTLAAVLMGGLVMVMSQQINLLISVPMGALVYWILVFVLRGFSPEDLALFRQVWPSRRRRGVPA